MRVNDMGSRLLTDFGVAMVLLTRLPLPRLPDHAFKDQSRAVWAFPLAGLAVALPAGVAGIVMLWLGLPAGAAAGIVLAVQIALTGALHEDGLADTADGFWGGSTVERRLATMKDSRIGTYGVVALVLSLGLRWLALAALLPSTGVPVLVATACLSRGVLPAMMAWLPHARADGMSRSVGRPAGKVALVAITVGGTVAVACVGTSAILPALAACACIAALAFVAMRKVGGQTGDVLGAAQQVGEIVFLLGLLASAG